MATHKPTTTDQDTESTESAVPQSTTDTLAPERLKPTVIRAFPRTLVHTTCRGCGAALINVQHENTRKFAPIDAEPSIYGNVVALDNGCYRVLRQPALSLLPPDIMLYANHYMTCPQKEVFRYYRSKPTK
jgi:hypothetical protein